MGDKIIRIEGGDYPEDWYTVTMECPSIPEDKFVLEANKECVYRAWGVSKYIHVQGAEYISCMTEKFEKIGCKKHETKFDVIYSNHGLDSRSIYKVTDGEKRLILEENE